MRRGYYMVSCRLPGAVRGWLPALSYRELVAMYPVEELGIRVTDELLEEAVTTRLLGHPKVTDRETQNLMIFVKDEGEENPWSRSGLECGVARVRSG